MIFEIHTLTEMFLIFQVEHRSLTLGEVLDGDRMAKAMYDIKFKRKFHLLRLKFLDNLSLRM